MTISLFRDGIQELSSALRPFQSYWQAEPMGNYPLKDHFIPFVPQIVMDELERVQDFPIQQLTDYANGEIETPLTEQVQKLLGTYSPQSSTEEYPLAIEFKEGVNQKKQHEIKRLVPTIKHFTSITDVGGGVGHMAQHYCSASGGRATCVDMDFDLQEKGRRRIKGSTIDLNYLHRKVEDAKDIPGDGAIIGLHACGDLSVELMKAAVKSSRPLVNVPCCYHKLLDYRFALSSVGKEQKITYSMHALGLAAKHNHVYNASELQTRYRVKQFRYILHMFGIDQYGAHSQPVGSFVPRIYRGDFSDYAQLAWDQAYPGRAYDQRVEKYFKDYEHSQAFHQLFLTGLVRAHFGRLLELLLIYDRARYCEEHGAKPKLLQVFDRSRSPRNIALIIEA